MMSNLMPPGLAQNANLQEMFKLFQEKAQQNPQMLEVAQQRGFLASVLESYNSCSDVQRRRIESTVYERILGQPIFNEMMMLRNQGDRSGQTAQRSLLNFSSVKTLLNKNP